MTAPAPAPGQVGRAAGHRETLEDIGDTYNRCLVDWWTSGKPGDRCPDASERLEDARKDLDRAGRRYT